MPQQKQKPHNTMWGIKTFKKKSRSYHLWGPKCVVNHMALAGLPQGWTDPQALVSRAALSIYPWAGSSAKAGNGSKTEPLCSPSSQKNQSH